MTKVGNKYLNVQILFLTEDFLRTICFLEVELFGGKSVHFTASVNTLTSCFPVYQSYTSR